MRVVERPILLAAPSRDPVDLFLSGPIVSTSADRRPLGESWQDKIPHTLAGLYMTGTIPLGLLEASAVCEIANIGLGHATTALAGMTGRTIDMSVPDAASVPLEELPLLLGSEELSVGVYMPIIGDVEGHVAFVIPWSGAQRLWTMLLGAAPESPDDIDALHASVLTEVGNVIDGGFLSAIADLTGLRLEATPPLLCIDMGIAVIGAIVCEAASTDSAALAVRTTISESGEDLQGTFLFVPSVGGLRRIFGALGIEQERA